MTLPAQSPSTTIAGNGLTTVFSYSFEIPFQDDGSTPAVAVYLQNGILDPVFLSPSLYIINGVGVTTGGTVQYPIVGSPLPTGWNIIIARSMRYSQPYAFPNSGAIQPRQLEEALDRVVLEIQQLSVSGGGGSPLPPPVVSGVTSFNGRVDVVVLLSSDVVGALGYTPMNPAGATMTGRLDLAPSTTLGAGLNVGQGNAPTAPVNGDLWATAAGFYGRAGGVTVGPWGTGGGGSFDQNTQFVTGPSGATANLSLIQRFRKCPNIYDYGAVGDGVTDDTAAWNRYVDDINSGITRDFYLPSGEFRLNGITNVFIRGFNMRGDGTGASSVRGGAGLTTPLINLVDGTTFTDGRTSIHDITFKSSGAKTQPLMDLVWAIGVTTGSHQRCNITNVDVQQNFKSGIQMTNVIEGVFAGVNIIGGPVGSGNMDFGWYITATPGDFSVACKWDKSAVSTANYSWKGDGHLEGMFWNQCEAGFGGWGWHMDISDTTNAPEFRISGGQSEVFSGGVFIRNAAYVAISDYSFYVSNGATSSAPCVYLDNVANFNIHDNVAISLNGSTPWTYLQANNCAQGKSHDSNIGFMTTGSYGHLLTGTTNNIEAQDNRYYAVSGTTGYPWGDSTGSQTNQQRGVRTDSSLIQFTRTSQAGVVPQTVGTAFVIVAQAVPMVVRVGEEFRIQASLSVNNPVGNVLVSVRIREYNHRPAAPVPYAVFNTVDGETSVNEIKYLTAGGACAFYFDTTVRIVGAADDALIVMEVSTNANTADVTAGGIRVQGI